MTEPEAGGAPSGALEPSAGVSCGREGGRARFGCCFSCVLVLAALLALSAALSYLFFKGSGVPRIEFKNVNVHLTSSSISSASPEDRWVVATIRGELSDTYVLERPYMTDLVFRLNPLPAYYNYFVPLNDPRWSVRYSSYASDSGGRVEIAEVSLPDVEFDDSAAVVDISRLDIVSENSAFVRFESTAEDLRRRLVARISDRYREEGAGGARKVLARRLAEESVKGFVARRLAENGVDAGAGCVFKFNWIPDSGSAGEAARDGR